MKNITICPDIVTIKSTMNDNNIADMEKMAEEIK